MDQPFQRPKVLLVDDEAYLREIYEVELTREGFEVLLAEDGESGLALMQSEKPDAVLLDLQMPGKTGLDVLVGMQNSPELKKIPVIILSNVDEEEMYRKVGQFETRFYFVKALTTPKKVAKVLREVLR